MGDKAAAPTKLTSRRGTYKRQVHVYLKVVTLVYSQGRLSPWLNWAKLPLRPYTNLSRPSLSPSSPPSPSPGFPPLYPLPPFLFHPLPFPSLPLWNGGPEVSIRKTFLNVDARRWVLLHSGRIKWSVKIPVFVNDLSLPNHILSYMKCKGAVHSNFGSVSNTVIWT